MKKFLVGLCLFIASCATLEAPANVSEGSKYALAQVTAVRASCAKALAAEHIAVDDARVCLSYTDQAREYINMAERATNETEKLTYLNQALEILHYVEEALRIMEAQKS